MELPALYGGMETLSAAEKLLPDQDLVRRALRDLRAVASRLPPERVNIDFADMRGYHYYTGITFAVYVDGAQASLLRGGRYDEVGAAFGRARPAAGFSLDLRELAMHSPVDGSRKAVLAPWGDDPALREAIARLRAEGETVVVALPAQAHAPDEYTCDRALRLAGGRWCVQPIKQS
jgi:ATP phosphoribosyltransferase regulatory subunit